jgi:L-proline 4-hydroxylase
MNITREQVNSYREKGYLLVSNCFSAAEVAAMKAEVASAFSEDSPRRVMEKDGAIVRSVYGSHKTSEVFSRLVRHPNILKPAKAILGSEVYVYQFKINAKAAFGGDVWEWHQDFIFWRNEDGMTRPRVMSVAIFLDEVTEYNGPMLLIPGSHREGVIDVPAKDKPPVEAYKAELPDLNRDSWISNLTANLRYSLSKESVTRLVLGHGIESPKGPAGSVVFFDGNIAHASAGNISPFDRVVVLITFNSIENIPSEVKNPRPEFLVSRDYTPVVPLGENASLA